MITPHHRHAIISAYPELEGASFTVLDAGWDSLAVDADGRFIFKFPRDADGEHCLRREAALLTVLHPRLTMAVPDPVIFDGPPLFSAHEKLRGDHLLAADYARLSDEARDGLALDMARFHTEMHALSDLSIATVGDAPIEPWQSTAVMREAGVTTLPSGLRDKAMTEIAAYEALAPDPHGTIFGYFDAHGWNMAFHHERGALNGIYDFADSGVGPLHQEFIYANFISRDHSARVIAAYEQLTGRDIDRRRVEILTAMLHLSDLAEYAEQPDYLDKVLEHAVPWFDSA